MLLEFELFNKKRAEMKIGKLNVIYGHSNSGKSFILNQIINGINQKGSSYFKIDGRPIIKNEYDVIYIDDSQNIMEQLKFGSKSILRKLLFSEINNELEENEDLLDEINHTLDNTTEKIKLFVNDLNNNTINGSLNLKLHLDSFNDILTNILKINFGEDEQLNCSSSTAKELLYSLYYNYVKIDNRCKIVLIDNFDSSIDEEITINVVNNIKRLLDYNTYFILTTNKPTSLSYLINVGKIFCLKNNDIFDLTVLDKFFKYSFQTSNRTTNYTFEEFILNQDLFIDNITLENNYEKLKTQIQYNVGRLLTNKNYQIINTTSFNDYKNQVSIFCNNDIEYKFLKNIDNYINNKHLIYND